MIKVLQLIFSPFPTWQKIAEKNRGLLFVLFLYVLPLLILASVVEGAGLLKWGEKRSEFSATLPVSEKLMLKYELVQVGLDVLMLFMGAQLLSAVAKSFHLNSTYSQAFNTVAYGFSPIFVLHMLDGLPAVNTWICWGLGAGLSMMILYHGVALVLKPDQTKGFGIYITTLVFMLIFSALGHFVSWSVLHEKLLRHPMESLRM